ncbi:MAG: tRNA (adenosine(37)-N6)-threonylcarbamoyltransferase complex dimerization subunit type 1 TsaB [Paracoccus sp. (in: a-proteobacteria)]|uniref:tRNA (adenosine(37)-N6)-threonylcarbamoyltransferase complex dimerization subunit type 1 TsaB n=1 Tax=Paracoccus sp. TaxID=267 RepID=UPI0026DF9619|nr:tRNA (adenosine(37)-N6)-threonylcarbamoyltransferase complex dimerization subunit type 1 TsaB [Paracoccus sp. (in: a-proteobacteria)]MDO5611660.1 tRNA (adenosine(37)-N6)-threonylcarbamoyltransferase complex dimerization subunit type 1 TsaB [Paracoccus sp. (in: a-proteobacteria)]
MPEPLVLAFDTSAAHCAAALLSGDRVLAAAHQDMAKGQAEHLFPLLEQVLADAGKGWADLDVIGVGIGPGNFTGVRISVAAARGLALSLGVPTVGVTTLQALRHGLPGVVVASADARQDRLYVQVFDAGDAPPVLCDLHSLPAIPAQARPLCVGHGADRIAAACGGQVAAPAFALPVAIARIAAARRDNPGPPPAPLYLRPADAAPARDSGPVILT